MKSESVGAIMSLNINSVGGQQVSFGKEKKDDNKNQSLFKALHYASNIAVVAGIAADSYGVNSSNVPKKYQEDVKKLQQEIEKIDTESLTADSKSKVIQGCQDVSNSLEASANKKISFFERYINILKPTQKSEAEKHLETLKDKKLEALEGATDEIKQAVQKINAETERLGKMRADNWFLKAIKENKWFTLSIIVPLIGYMLLKGLNKQNER